MKKQIALFEEKKIRRVWDEKKEKWLFSVIDIVAVLTDQGDSQAARKYWNKLAERLKKEGSETVTKCHRLKLVAEDRKMRETDVADTETLLRLIQSMSIFTVLMQADKILRSNLSNFLRLPRFIVRRVDPLAMT